MPPFGRTNAHFPATWLSLSVPSDPSEIEPMVRAAVASGCPIDISASPALWGGHMRGTDAVLLSRSDPLIEHAVDDKHAADLTQAHLIETLSCIGREHIDFYFLRVRRALEENQIAGWLAAVESARQEGHIKFIGLASEGSPLAVQAVWQFHDAFEVLMIPYSTLVRPHAESLRALARERRVGVLATGERVDAVEAGAQLLKVSSADQIRAVLEA